MDLHRHLRLMAGYHLWAYRRLYAEVDKLAEADYFADTGLFFRGIHGTLNHLLVVEHLWRERLDDAPRTIHSLDQVLHADRDALRTALLDYAGRWQGHVDALDAAGLAADLAYRNLQGDAFTLPRASAIAHVFNHATHHRGQISAALTRLGAQAPVMDLPYYLLELPREASRR